jgi:8-oxo-dGTP diphosphatase
VEPLEVVAAVLVRDGRVLACRRAPGKEPGESREAALLREIREELGVDILIGELLDRSVTTSGGRAIDLACFRAELTGEPPTTSTDHDALLWVRTTELAALEWAAADVPAVQILTA